MIKLHTTKTGQQLAIIEGDQLSNWVVEHDSLVVEKHVCARLCKLLKPGDTVVDAGACIGDHTYAYAQAVGPTGRVLAFEPYLPSFVCLSMNVREFPQVECVRAALSNDVSTIQINPDLHNVGATHAGKLTRGTHPNDLVRVTTLDGFSLPYLRLFKIDVEGLEPLVLKGANQTIEDCRPIIYIEINHPCLARYGFTYEWDILAPLTALHYHMEPENPQCSIDKPQSDVFFLPD